MEARELKSHLGPHAEEFKRINTYVIASTGRYQEIRNPARLRQQDFPSLPEMVLHPPEAVGRLVPLAT